MAEMMSSCGCGNTEVLVNGPPVMRFICHCSICQKVYQKPYADIVAFKASQIIKPIDKGVIFTKHRSPPAVNRGVCPECDCPVIAYLSLLPYMGFAFIPASNFSDEASLPLPHLHSFYDKRVENVEDNLPKFEGYWSSQWAVSRQLLSSIFK